MHTYLTCHAQPHRTSDYRIFVAEVASTMNEFLLHDYLMARAQRAGDMRMVALLLNEQCEAFKSTVFRQTMFAELDREMHGRLESGRPVTQEAISNAVSSACHEFLQDFKSTRCTSREISYLCRGMISFHVGSHVSHVVTHAPPGLYMRLNSLYFGEVLPADDPALTSEAGAAIPWWQPPGLTRTCIQTPDQVRVDPGAPSVLQLLRMEIRDLLLCLSGLHRALTTNPAHAQPRYLALLRAGSTQDPADILAAAGFDPRCPGAFDSALAEFGGLVAELEQGLCRVGGGPNQREKAEISVVQAMEELLR
ncbi:putative oligoendopeptidase F [Paratrimastix pyriformis]|uniref:Oligoendopeptidase F n=1 Tax=Paratrimastix pyriformis TaxID=342808 RepID=A0ABQ8U9N3_9EUKA|nr:putative oligoendopeptidase F [Paratrimastix pyriformis]